MTATIRSVNVVLFQTEVRMFLECPSTCASRRMLFTNVSKILAEENVSLLH